VTKRQDATYITRMDYPRVHGWVVRLPARSDGSQPGELFSDGIYGGKQKSQSAALAWRDKTFTAMRGAPPNGRYVHRRQKRGAKSGRVGVVLVRKRSTSRGIDRRIYVYERLSWVAKWSESLGEVRSKYFSVRAWGYSEARRLAIAHRAKMEKRVLGLV